MTNRADNFNRADSDTSLGTPSDGGSAWVAASGTWGTLSNAGYKQLSNDVHDQATLESSIADCDVQVTITGLGNGAGGGGIAARLSDTNNYIHLTLNGGGSSLTLYKRVAGAFTQLGSSYSFTLQVGDVLKQNVNGSSLTAYVNGVSRITATDSFNSTATKHGLLAYGSFPTGSGIDRSLRFDTFSIAALSSDTSFAPGAGLITLAGLIPTFAVATPTFGATFSFSQPSNKQPTQPAGVDWQNQFARGLLRLYDFGQTTNNIDVVAGTPVKAGSGEQQGYRGLLARAIDAGGRYGQWDGSFRAQIKNKFTWFLVADFSTTSSSFIFGNVEAASTGYNSGLYIGAGGAAIVFVKTGGTGVSAQGTSTLVGAGLLVLAGTYDGDASSLVIYVNGVSEGSNSVTGDVDQGSFDVLLNHWNGTNGNIGHAYLGGVSNRCWSPGEVRAFSTNPWQLFKGQRKILGAAQSSTPGPIDTSFAPGAGLITLAGLNPTFAIVTPVFGTFGQFDPSLLLKAWF